MNTRDDDGGKQPRTGAPLIESAPATESTTGDADGFAQAFAEIARLRERGVARGGVFAMAGGPRAKRRDCERQEANKQNAFAILKIERFGKRQSFTLILNDSLRDKRLGGLARGIFAYAMTLPPTWKLHSWYLQKEFQCGRIAVRTAMQQLVDAGYARLEFERGNSGRIIGQCWRIRMSPKIPWNSSHREVDDRPLGTERSVNRLSVNRPQEELKSPDSDKEPKKKRRMKERGRARGTSTPDPKPSSDDVSPSCSSVHQNQVQKAEASPLDIFDEADDEAKRWAAEERARWATGQPLANYEWWPEFEEYCRAQGGQPNVEAFWRTWLPKQKREGHRPRVKSEQPGVVVDGKFLTHEEANRRALAGETTILENMIPAVRHANGTVEILRNCRAGPAQLQ
jgi:hypothetical protein